MTHPAVRGSAGSPDPSPRRPKVAIPVGSMRNQCPVCGELFGGVKAFDMHKVGRIGVDRRCATAAEMPARGLRLVGGQWSREAPTFDNTGSA